MGLLVIFMSSLSDDLALKLEWYEELLRDLKARFKEYGINIHVVWPGQSNCMYHGEDAQEDFLVLSGECLLLVEGEERRLQVWDFVHFPNWTEHVIVGAGSGPCAILMVGTRGEGRGVRSPVAEHYGSIGLFSMRRVISKCSTILTGLQLF